MAQISQGQDWGTCLHGNLGCSLLFTLQVKHLNTIFHWVEIQSTGAKVLQRIRNNPVKKWLAFFKIYFYVEDHCFTIGLASAIQQCESATDICTFLPSNLSPTPHHPTPPGCHRAPAALPASHRNFPLAICFTYGNVYGSVLFSQFIQPFPSSIVSKVCSLCRCLFSCPAKRFISTIFLDSIYMH